LTRCVRLVTYRVSKWFWCSGMYSCVCV